MTPRQRVQHSIDHQIPDRVPTALWGGPYGLVDELYYDLLDYLELGQPVPRFRSGHTINHIDDRLLTALGTDTRYVWPGASPTSPRHATDDARIYLDDFGQKWVQTYPYYTAADGLLKNADDPIAIDELVQWPDATDPLWTQGVSDRARLLAEKGEHYIIARMVVSHGPFQLASDLRGAGEFMMDMSLHPNYAAVLLERVTDVICGLTQAYLEVGGEYFDMIELPGDDYASNQNLIISPGMFRDFIKPCIARVVETIRNFRSDLKIMLHSDGAVTALIPDFIELGIDVLHPLEPVSGMDVARVKEEYGSKIAFLGGVDITHAMPGTLEDVRSDVERCMQSLAPFGGYILAPCNHLQADVPAENVVELFRFAKEVGGY